MNLSYLRSGTGAIATLLAMAACQPAAPPEEVSPAAEAADKKQAETTETAEAEMAWRNRDRPALFDDDLVFEIDQLPRTGAADVAPWAGNYWPTYQDNINYRWDGDNPSPSEKYGEAFGVENITDAVSRHHGIDSRSSSKACTESSECDSQLGEACAKRTGAETGRCIPTWFGICHAWAPAAILYEEPREPVTHNGVTFKVNDIKALLTLANEDIETKFVSTRCNDDDGRDEITYDEFGRPSETGTCIDTNPATYHVLLTNYLGIRQESFVEDRTFDDEVWNQPLRAYRVTKLEEVTAAEANALVGVKPTGGVSEEISGQLAQNQWQHLGPFAVEAGASVRAEMTGDGDADIYVHFAAQPTTGSYTCRPYTGGSNELCELTAPEGATQVFVSVNGYAQNSNFEVKVNAGGAMDANYRFNPNAKRFFHVRTEVDYISESPASQDGHLGANIDRYTHTDRYEYVLEAGQDGKLQGGEWLGSSKRAHPDFLWLPISTRESGRIAGGKIKFSDIQTIYNLSIGQEGPTVENKSGTVTRNQWSYYGPFEAKANTRATITMTGTGDADLYVRSNAQPTAGAYDCRPYKNGSNENCSVAAGGIFYVAVHGYAARSTFNLEITYTPAGDGGDPVDPDPVEVTHLDEAGNLAQNEWARFTVNVQAGRSITIQTTAANDVDLYVRMGSAPSLSRYDHRPYTASGNETVTMVPTADGVLHVAVHGYAASDFTLKTQD